MLFLRDQHTPSLIDYLSFKQILPKNNRSTSGCFANYWQNLHWLFFRQPLDNPAYIESEKALSLGIWKEVSESIPAVNIVVNLWTSLWSVSCIKSQNFLPQQCYPQLEKKCLLQTYILNHVYLMTFCPLRLKLFGYNDVIFTTTHVNQLYSKNKCQDYTCSCKLWFQIARLIRNGT